MDELSPTRAREAPDQSATIYQLIRDDILRGRLPTNSRLKASALAASYGTSTNPVREALQQLRGEGFVVITPNRGARVRSIDDQFVRDIYEMEMLIEPYLTGWYVDLATDEDIARLEALQQRIEETGFDDTVRYSELDTRFHRIFYDKHYNRHAVDLWWKHRDILSAMSRDIPFARWRGEAIIREHRELIACVKRHDAAGAANVVAMHVRGSGQHLTEQMRVVRRNGGVDT
jgi:DNA-binding GntR family transcriptional regulator